VGQVSLGDPAIRVCTVDTGVELTHPDLWGQMTDGSPQLARGFDFSGMRELTVAGYAPDSAHGMNVVGVIAAHTNNTTQIAGIAPNTGQICLEKPNLKSATYACLLYWAAGFTTGNPDPAWPAEPLAQPADIISCSHGVPNLPISDLLKETYHDLAVNGRNGRGTVVIYASGKEGDLISGTRSWAAWPDNIAVGSTQRSANPAGTETRAPLSNYGPELDVTAQGEGIRSLGLGGQAQAFGGTSAAAPTVAGVVALMLSHDPTLTRDQVVAILTGTAKQVDAVNNDPVGKWVGGFSQWYGHGRVDAGQAVADSLPGVNRSPGIEELALPVPD
jgi:subtilisin family serine protease